MAAHQAPLSLGFSRQEHWSGLPFSSPMQGSEKWKWSRSVLSNYYWPHGLQPTRCSCPWDLPGNSTGVGCHCLLCEGSLVFPFCCFPLFICIDHWRKLSYFSLQFFGTLHSNGCISFSPLPFASLFTVVAQTVKRLSTMRETQVQSLDSEDPLEKETAIHSSTIAWKIPWTEEPGRLQSVGSQRVGHNWATSCSGSVLEMWILNHWTTREAPHCFYFYMHLKFSIIKSLFFNFKKSFQKYRQ